MGSEELKARAQHYRQLAQECGAADLARLLDACAVAYEREAGLFERLGHVRPAETRRLA